MVAFAVGITLHGCSEEKSLASVLCPGIYFDLLDAGFPRSSCPEVLSQSDSWGAEELSIAIVLIKFSLISNRTAEVWLHFLLLARKIGF